MANTFAPFGFSQYRGTGSAPTYEQVTALIASGNATAIFYGDAVVPVTGSATGVGAAAAIMLAERGCNIVVNYTRSKVEAEETAATCRAKGADVIVYQGDVAEDASCRGMADAAIERWSAAAARPTARWTAPRPPSPVQKSLFPARSSSTSLERQPLRPGMGSIVRRLGAVASRELSAAFVSFVVNG